MTRPQDAEQEPSPAAAQYMRLPVPIVAAALAVFLVILLGAGLYANANLRPGEVVAAPTPAPTSAAASIAAAAPTGVPTAQPTATPVVAPTATPAPAVAAVPPVPTAGATPLIIVLDATLTPSIEAAQPQQTESPTPLPTVQPTLAADVGQAYEHFWRVTSQALFELDDSHLSEVMDGEYLSAVTQRIDELRSEGRAIKTQVALNYAVIQASDQSATVVDDFEDNSVFVNAGTDEPISEPTGDRVRTLYKLSKSSGVW